MQSGLSSSPGSGGIFLFSTPSRQALGPIQSPIQWVTSLLSPEVKWPARETDHLPPASSEVFISPREQGGNFVPPGTGFPFRRLLRLTGSRWRDSNPPLLITSRLGRRRKHRLQQFLYFCAWVRCRGNVFVSW
jgi:hypothetical protein